MAAGGSTDPCSYEFEPRGDGETKGFALQPHYYPARPPGRQSDFSLPFLLQVPVHGIFDPFPCARQGCAQAPGLELEEAAEAKHAAI